MLIVAHLTVVKHLPPLYRRRAERPQDDDRAAEMARWDQAQFETALDIILAAYDAPAAAAPRRR
jgi:hypothetical protein